MISKIVKEIFGDVEEFKRKAQKVLEDNHKEIHDLQESAYSDYNAYKLYNIGNQNILIGLILAMIDNEVQNDKRED